MPAVREAAAKSTKPHYFMSMRPGVLHCGQIRILAEAGVAVIGGTRQGLGAIERLARWNTPLPPARVSKAGALPDTGHADRRTINEFDAKTHPRRLRPAGDARDARDVARRGASQPRGPSAFRSCSRSLSDDIPHKSEHGLVAVGLARRARARRCLRATCSAASLRSARPIAGYLVQEMIADGVEVFAGVSARPAFRPDHRLRHGRRRRRGVARLCAAARCRCATEMPKR